MKNLLREYLELNEKEKITLWKDAVFIFDTNVLFNLYRYSAKTSNALMEAIENLSDRIWLPYNIAQEYLNKRCEVIYNTQSEYDNVYLNFTKNIDDCKEKLRKKDDDEDINELTLFIKNWFDKNKDSNLLVKTPSDDYILDRILGLYENKIGDPFDSGTLNDIKKRVKKGIKTIFHLAIKMIKNKKVIMIIINLVI